MEEAGREGGTDGGREEPEMKLVCGVSNRAGERPAGIGDFFSPLASLRHSQGSVCAWRASDWQKEDQPTDRPLLQLLPPPSSLYRSRVLYLLKVAKNIDAFQAFKIRVSQTFERFTRLSYITVVPRTSIYRQSPECVL